jgi:hypothetical protein
MADDKSGRDKQAQDAAERRRERDLATELERGDEAEPAIVAEVESALSEVSFPATGREVVAVVGDRAVETEEGPVAAAALVPDSDAETFDAPVEVADRVARPTVAGAMKRVVAACEGNQGAELRGSQRDAYERTFQALREIDALDDDEGIGTVADWVVDHIEETGALPGSRAVRRQAATVARDAGYEVRNDEWLGV